MSCRSVSHLLPLFDDPELSAEERASVAAHLASCNECAQELATIRRAQLQLASWRVAETPASGPDAIIARLSETGRQSARWRRRFTRPQWAGALAACVVAMVLWITWPDATPISPAEDAQPTPMLFMATQEGTAPFAASRSLALDPLPPMPLEIVLHSDDPLSSGQKLVARLAEITPETTPILLEMPDGSVQVQLEAVTPARLHDLLSTVEQSDAVEWGYDGWLAHIPHVDMETALVVIIEATGASN